MRAFWLVALPLLLATAAQAQRVQEIVVVAPAPLGANDTARAPYTIRSIEAGTLDRAATLPGALESQFGAVTLQEALGNSLQPNLRLRGFDAAPLEGVPQGIAVYVDGARANEAFGDTVNWDLIPAFAIDRVEIASPAPSFGFNALGGAALVRLKDGFSSDGRSVTLTGDTLGRVGVQAEIARRIDELAIYAGASGDDLHGWRDHAASSRRLAYLDLGARPDRAELHLSATLGDNRLAGAGTTPVELLARRRSAVLSWPDFARNRLALFNLRGTFDLDSATRLELGAYARFFRHNETNGNPLDDDDDPRAAVLNQLASSSTGGGMSAQLAHRTDLLGRTHLLQVGTSLDAASVRFSARNERARIGDDRRVTSRGGEVIDDELQPVRLDTTNRYAGIFLLDAIELGGGFTATVGARWNDAGIELRDRLGTALNGSHHFSRLNPSVGLTWQGDVTLYANYTESNRVPTAAELSCASPEQSCTLANFFVADPPLRQVVARTVELGLRDARFHAVLFRSELSDDILTVASELPGRGYFQNVGRTRRQGVEAGAVWQDGPSRASIDLAWLDATFRSALSLPSPDNPFAPRGGTIAVKPGDTIPGTPHWRGNLRLERTLDDALRLGATLVLTSAQRFRGDEANLAPKLRGWARLDLDASYEVSDSVAVQLTLRNALDADYATFGTYTDVGDVPASPRLRDRRVLAPAAPRSLELAMRVRF